MQRPGSWIDVRVFDTEFNASITGSCLQGGYLRVEPRDGDEPYVGPKGQRWMATPSPVEPQVVEQPEG